MASAVMRWKLKWAAPCFDQFNRLLRVAALDVLVLTDDGQNIVGDALDHCIGRLLGGKSIAGEEKNPRQQGKQLLHD
jgi:hypothetical protein